MLMVLIVNDDASRKETGKLVCICKMTCSRPLFLFQGAETLFPTFLGDVISPVRMWAKCVTSGLRQLNVSVNVHPLLLFATFLSSEQLGSKNFEMMEMLVEALGSESLLKENSIPTWSTRHWNMRET